MAASFQSYPLLSRVQLTRATPAAPVRPAMPAPSLTTLAQQELNPILSRITSAINARTQTASKAITGYTSSLAQALAGVDYGAPYEDAQAKQAAVDASLAQSLSGGGQQIASDLASRLAQIGEPGVTGAAADAVKGNAVGNANTVLGAGSSNLGQLIANEASAKAYGAKLPGVAKQAGLNDLASLLGQAQNDVATQTADVEKQLPSVINALRSAQLHQQDQAALNKYRNQTLTATKDYRASELTLKAQQAGQLDAYRQQLITLRQQGLINDQQYRKAELALRQQGLDLSGARLANQTASKPNPSLSRALGHEVDQYGHDVGSSVGGYVSPVAPGTSIMRQDHGQDYQGKAGQHVFAIGNGVVDYVKNDPGGYGQTVYYTLADGSKQQIFVGHAQPNVKAGDHVREGQPIATLLQHGGGDAYNLSGWTEVGLAKGGAPEYPKEGGVGGQKFNAFLRSAGHAAPLPGDSYNPATGQYVKASTAKASTLTATSQASIYAKGVKLAQSYMGKQVLGKLVGTKPFPQAYNGLVSYFVGSGITDPNRAKQLALTALTAAGYAQPGGVGVTP